MTKAFKAGDRVRCISVRGFGTSGTIPKVDGIYFVERVAGKLMTLVGIVARGTDSWWSFDNFEAAPLPAFKVGDRVKIVADLSGLAPSSVGKIGTISEDQDPNCLGMYRWRVTYEGDSVSFLDGINCADAELVHEPKPTRPAIVARLSQVDRRPLPAPRPREHYDTDTAIAEAERLASNEPGVEFAVYEQVAVSKAERPPLPVAVTVRP